MKYSGGIVMPDWLYELDVNILLFIQEHLRFDFLTPILKFLTMLGDHGMLWIGIALLLVLVKRTRPIGATAGASLAINALLVNVFLKNIVARTRPYEVIDGLTRLVGEQSDFSFPSGHTSSAFSVAVVMFMLMPKKYGVPALIMATLIAYSRLYVGVHYPSDVIGGIIVGILAAVICVAIYKKIEKRNGENFVIDEKKSQIEN